MCRTKTQRRCYETDVRRAKTEIGVVGGGLLNVKKSFHKNNPIHWDLTEPPLSQVLRDEEAVTWPP